MLLLFCAVFLGAGVSTPQQHCWTRVPLERHCRSWQSGRAGEQIIIIGHASMIGCENLNSNKTSGQVRASASCRNPNTPLVFYHGATFRGKKLPSLSLSSSSSDDDVSYWKYVEVQRAHVDGRRNAPRLRAAAPRLDIFMSG